MSKYYNSKRTKNLYDLNASTPFKLSRSKIELFVSCPRCFYLDRRLGIGQPGGFPFTLNNAVDSLLKREFDQYRSKKGAHPIIKKYGIDAIPADNDRFSEWRNNFKGIPYLHKATNLLITGALDDLWQNSRGEYIVVDYKATSKNKEIIKLDEDWHDTYKRQLEVYQWLIRKNGYKVSKTGYIVYCNGKTDCDAFDCKLDFDITLVPHEGNDNWVEGTIKDIHTCLRGNTIPPSGDDCDFCAYREEAKKHE